MREHLHYIHFYTTRTDSQNLPIQRVRRRGVWNIWIKENDQRIKENDHNTWIKEKEWFTLSAHHAQRGYTTLSEGTPRSARARLGEYARTQEVSTLGLKVYNP